MRTSSEVLIELDRSRPRGLRVQVEGQLRDAVRSGRLAPGTALPSSRSLAIDLGVTRGVVVAAYDQLIAEGYFVARAGSGTVVGATPRGGGTGRAEAADAADVDIDFSPGLPDLDLFPRAAWMRATRHALATVPSGDLGYIDSRGLPKLRAALVDYLARVRGVNATPDQVVVCNGFGHGFSLVAAALRGFGHDLVAVEDPGYWGPRVRLESVGGRHRGIEVDAEGIVVERLRRSGARAVVVTPAHQAPTGAVLSPTRRAALVAWARDVDGYVIEDDYDAEYRYDRHPIGALQGVAPERVIYSGTSSKSLAPGLRLGWLVVPELLVESILDRRRASDEASSSFTQATFASFLTSGDLDRHLRRTRRIYRQRRDALIAALARWLPEATPSGASAGLHVLVTLPPDVDEDAVAEHALAAGVRVHPLRRYRTSRRTGLPPALVLGYGPLAPAMSERGVRLVAAAVASARSR